MAAAPIRPLAWEPPYAAEAAQEIAKRQKKINKYKKIKIKLKKKKKEATTTTQTAGNHEEGLGDNKETTSQGP